jgi:hypothetical protein
MKPIVASRTFAEKYTLTVIIAICALFHACKKTDDPRVPHVPNPPGTKVGLLKDINVQSLPSPYYHFDYTDEGVTTGVSFASGFFIYELSYVNGRLDKMVNLPNNNALVYEYNNGKVISIRVRRPDKSIVYHYTFDYNSKSLLTQIRYYLAGASGADSILFKKVLFSYYNDDNLERYEKYVDVTGQNLELAVTEKYSDYDQGKNVDGFRHYKDFFDHVLHLPDVRFQKNNPRKIVITGQQTDYEVNDTWTYQNDLPVSKQSKIRETRGANAGREINSGTTFSYY